MCKSRLIFKYGQMSSGKSMQLLANAYSFDERNIPFIILKSSIDTRDGYGVVHSRSLGDRECIIINPEDDIIKVLENGSIIKNGKIIKFILVDEAQFLTEKQVNQLSDIVDFFNINVICYGLRSDFQTHLFQGSKRLFEIADSFEEIKSMCSCGEKDLINVRVDENGDVVTEGNQIEVGGNDRYVSMCRRCYKEKLHEKNKRNKLQDK